MGNSYRGEHTLWVEGKPVILKLSINALCEFESVTGGVPATESLSNLTSSVAAGNVNLSLLRALLWASLSSENQKATLQDAEMIIEKVGIKEAFEAAVILVSKTFAKSEDGAVPPAEPKSE